MEAVAAAAPTVLCHSAREARTETMSWGKYAVIVTVDTSLGDRASATTGSWPVYCSSSQSGCEFVV